MQEHQEMPWMPDVVSLGSNVRSNGCYAKAANSLSIGFKRQH